ncbi:MAG: AAA family ATPase [Gemmataceae bacterium]|nr:AAA family ATPase [Gemmataceae bacterium]MCI0738181.1 AAA family ATPase [Gemmataceae bacterium]
MPFVPASQIEPENVSWMWPSHFAFDYLNILDGDPGLGKTFILLDLCARLSKGREWPDGTGGVGACASVYLSGEDHPNTVLRPRLTALGADLDRVHLWQRRPDEPWPYLPSRHALLRDTVAQRQARLLVIDPLFAFLDRDVLPAGDQDVRRALAPLALLAEDLHCCVIMARHPNKRGSGRALYRGSYSIAFNALCRSTWIVGRDPEVKERAVMAHVKSNFDPPQPSLAYMLKSGGNSMPELAWLGHSRFTDNDLVGGGPEGPRQRARAFLLHFLKDGPRQLWEIRDAGRAQGFTQKTLERARKTLDMRTEKVHANTLKQKTYWLLPGQKLAENLMSEDEAKVARWMDQVEARARAIQRGEYDPAALENGAA